MASFLEGRALSVTYMAFSPDGHVLVSEINDETLKLWEVTFNMMHDMTEPRKGKVI